MNLLPIPGAEIYYDTEFLAAQEATRFFEVLLSKCAWQRHRASFGHLFPRDEADCGEAGTHYTYSRRDQPLPWLPELLELKALVEMSTSSEAYSKLGLAKVGYNAVLCNLYRDGNDSVGLHADDEPEMGYVIASVSLGVEHVFRLKRKNGSVAFSERLRNGSLLVMSGQTQKNFKHEVPKEPGITQPRINLTFRRIEHKYHCSTSK
jgi:alkylated DNA repair dioxygenase AlkB